MSNSRKNHAKPTLKNKPTQPHVPASSRAASSASTLAPPPAPGIRTMIESKSNTAEITQVAIAEAAYFIWLKRGGDHMLNWLEAERQLRSKSAVSQH